MKQKEFKEQLIIRQKELKKELDAITTLLDCYGSDDGSKVEDNNAKDSKTESKGNRTWNEYAVYVLKKVGGRAKARKVVEEAIKANPDVSADRVRTAIKAKLSRQHLDGVIDAETTKNKRDGYVYKIKEEPHGSSN